MNLSIVTSRGRWIIVVVVTVLLIIIFNRQMVSLFFLNSGNLTLNSAQKIDGRPNQIGLQTAEELFRSALEIDEENIRGLRGLAFTLALQEKEVEALEVYDAAEIPPNEFVLLGDIDLSQGRFDEALAWYEKAREASPGQVHIWLKIASVYENLEDIKRAQDLYFASWEADPNLTAKAFARFLSSQGEMEQLEHVLQSSLNDSRVFRGRSWLWYQLGTVINNQERWEEALDIYDEAINEFPFDPQLYAARGLTLFESGENIKTAMTDFKRAIELDPNDPQAYFNGGTIFNSIGNYQQADEWFAKAIERNPGNSRWYLVRARNASSIPDYQLAAEVYEEAVRKFPAYEYAFLELAESYQDLGIHKSAIEALNSGVALFSVPDPPYYLRAAELFIWSQDYDRAATLYREILEIDPSNESALSGLEKISSIKE